MIMIGEPNQIRQTYQISETGRIGDCYQIRQTYQFSKVVRIGDYSQTAKPISSAKPVGSASTIRSAKSSGLANAPTLQPYSNSGFLRSKSIRMTVPRPGADSARIP